MGDVVNLNDYRKRLARRRKSRTSAENRARQGRNRAERERDSAETAKAEARLDAKHVNRKSSDGDVEPDDQAAPARGPRGDKPKDAG